MKKIEPNEAWKQCLLLYKNYYLDKNFSKETSSHWKKYGKFQKVKINEYDFDLKGIGFGEYKDKTLFNKFKNIPTEIYLKKLLKNCNKKIIKEIYFIANKHNKIITYDQARQALTLDKLCKSLNNLHKKTFCIIGDGYGNLGCLIKKIFPESKIIFINLGRTLLFDLYYTNKIFPNNKHNLVRNNDEKLSLDFNYIEAERYKKIDVQADIFINIVSMQEMNYDEINIYFEGIRKQNTDTWFYCCNRLSKKLEGGEIINFYNYPWLKEDEIIFDELCPWHQKFPISRPPFFKKFDGMIHHRLIKVAFKNKFT